MPSFVFGPNASYLNADRIDKAERTASGAWKIVIGDAVVDDNNRDFARKVTAIIPVNDQWEVLSLIDEDDGRQSLVAEPVIAWGLNILGETVPITPSSNSGVEQNSAVRRIGKPEVYVVGSCVHESVDDWMKSVSAPVRVTIMLTEGSLKNNYISLTSALPLFPPDIIGSSNASSAATNRAIVTFEPGGAVETDIDGTKNIFRARSEVGEFLKLSGAKEGDFVDIERVDPYTYKVSLRHK